MNGVCISHPKKSDLSLTEMGITTESAMSAEVVLVNVLAFQEIQIKHRCDFVESVFMIHIDLGKCKFRNYNILT